MTDPPHPILRRGERTELSGIEGFVLCEMGNSVVGSLTRASEYFGVPEPYFELLGRSAQAFRVQIHEEFCPSSPHSACGASTLDRLFATAPVELKSILKHGDVLDEEAVRFAVVRAINSGLPMLYSSEETGLIVGYLDDGNPWICLHPYAWHPNRFEESNLPSFSVDLLRPRATPLDAEAALTDALRAGLAMWDQGAAGPYLTGRAAYNHWIDAVSITSPEVFSRLSHGAYWTFDQLKEARTAAVDYLSAHRAYPEIKREFAAVVNALQAEGRCPIEVTTPAWADKHPATPESRSRYADILATARDHDTAAFAAIRELGFA